MSEHSCMRHQIMIRDCNGANVMIFLRLCENGVYWGGVVHDSLRDLFYGPHVLVQLGGMFDLIAKLANTDTPLPFMMAGPDSVPIEIKREMQADKIAAVLGCDEQAVRDHFGLMVKVG